MTYQTSDLGLATALTMFFPLDHTDNSNPKRMVFCFEDSPELQQAIVDYFDGKLKVVALDFMLKLKQMKARLYQSNYFYK